MKPEEAEAIVTAVEAIFSFHIGDGRDVWVRTVSRADAAAASEVVLNQWARGKNAPQFKPKLPDLMQAIRSEERLAEREAVDDQRSPLIPPDPSVVPDWVLARQILRQRGDMRAFPEQEPGYRELGMEWPPAQGLVTDEERVLLLMEVKPS